jgi:hypothetical protein
VDLRCGDTFLVPKSSDQTEHLWIVITPPEVGTAKAVCVSVTTSRAYSETTAVLQRGDHPFVNHESVIYYQDARILDLNLVERALHAGIGRPRPAPADSSWNDSFQSAQERGQGFL